jgi:XisH protein
MAKDLFHKAVLESLTKDNWAITQDPYRLVLSKRVLEIDIGAEPIIAAQKGREKIAVEVKSFLKESFIYEFYSVLGQYLVYETFLARQEPERQLYLAISDEVYALRFEKDDDVLFICQKYNLKILIFNKLTNQIESWIR